MLNFLKVSSRNSGKRLLPVSIAFAMILCSCGATAPNTDTSSTEASIVESVEVSFDTSTESVDASVSVEETVKEEETVEEAPAIIKVAISKRDVPDNDAQVFVKSLGAGWSLGNTFDAYDTSNSMSDLEYETYWQSAVTTKQNILDLKEAGIKTIRVPVSWHNHVDEDFNISEVWMNRVKEVVDWIIEEDMYVIINIHHDNIKGYMYPSYEKMDKSEKYVSTIWSQIAAVFGDYDEHLIFETLNEPRWADTPQEWYIDTASAEGKEAIDCVNKLNQVAVDAIRSTEGAYNKTRYIMCPGYCASPDYALADDYKLPNDSKAEAENRLLVSIHAYTPYNFALAGATDNPTDKFNALFSDSTSDINRFMMRIYNKFIKEDGIGVVIGEFGARDRNGNTNARAQFTAFYVANARSYGMSCLWWDNNNLSGEGEQFAIYNRRANKILYPEIMAQLSYYGNN